MVNQVNPIHEQKVYQNPFIENGVPHKISEQRILQQQTLNHKASQPNLSKIQIQYNNNQPKLSNFHRESRPTSQLVNTNISQQIYVLDHSQAPKSN